MMQNLLSEWRLGKAPQLLLQKKPQQPPYSPSAACAWVVFYLHIHKDFGLSFSTESQIERGAGSLDSNEHCIQFFCGSTEEPERGELRCWRVRTDSHRLLYFQPTSQAYVVFSPLTGYKNPFSAFGL